MTDRLTQDDLDTLTDLVARLILEKKLLEKEKELLETEMEYIKDKVKAIARDLGVKKKNWPYRYVSVLEVGDLCAHFFKQDERGWFILDDD